MTFRLLSAACCLLLGFAAAAANAQTKQDSAASLNVDSAAKAGLHLEKWREGMGPTDPPNGVLFWFDYTKWLQWLIPKKHPKAPPACEPPFNDDTIPPAPANKQPV